MAGYEEAIRTVTFLADSSLAGYTGVPGTPGAADPNYGNAQFRWVKVVGARTVGRSTGTADKVLTVGVCQNKPQVVGEAATVAIRGVSAVLSGAAIAAGAVVTSDSTGRAVTDGAGTFTLGVAIEATTGANQLVPVLLRAN
jgi:hypothetical protein